MDGLVSILREAGRRDAKVAAAWCWAAVHVIDALTVRIEAKKKPDPWFAEPAAQRLDPDAWYPLLPVGAILHRLNKVIGKDPYS